MTNKRNLKNYLFLLPCICLVVLAGAGLLRNQPELIATTDAAWADAASDKSDEEQGKTTAATAVSADEADGLKKLSVNTKGGFSDGVYTGSAQGFGGMITVRVRIEGGKIRSIDVISHTGETPAYYSRAKAVIAEILKKQSTDVDTVSGATYSSRGILNATAAALNKAGGRVTTAKTTAAKVPAQSDDSTAPSSKSDTGVPAGTPGDGVYTGSAECDKFGYTVSFKVRFRGGKAVALYRMKMSNNSDAANVSYMKKAWRGMVRKILKSQTDTADVVSGATYSSHAILAAFRNAYAKAVSGKASSSQTTAPAATPVRIQTASTSDPLPDGVPKDGTYRVSVTCSPDEEEDFEAYTLHADVTFSGGKCTAIQNLGSDAEGNRSYYQKAASGKGSEKGVVSQILAAQGVNGIYAVSGATCSSLAICELYRKALALAIGSGTDKGTALPAVQPTKQPIIQPTAQTTPTAAPVQPTSEAQNSPSPFPPLKNGSYEESTYVYPDEGEEFETYRISANVVFRDNVFAGFENLVISDTSNQFYINRALNGTKKKAGLLSQLVGTQAADADVVTGATCSSQALLELYKNALREAGGQ